MPVLKVAIIVADEREVFKKYDLPLPYFGPATTALLEGLKQKPGVEVQIISCVRSPVPVSKRLAENVVYHPVRVPQWGLLKTGYLPVVLAVRRKLRELRPDLVHGQGTEGYYAFAAAHSGLPNVITIHGNMRQVARALRARPFTFHWLIAHLEAWTIPRTKGVICLSRYTREQVQALARKTWLLPNAVDASFFSIERQVSDIPTALCVASVTPYKNQNRLIQLLDPVAAERPIRLVLVGGANAKHPYAAEFLQLVKTRPWCDFKGFQGREVLRSEFARAHMLVLPTLEDNCPLVVLEALAAGVPVAASRIGGIPDLIDDSVNGLLFDPVQPEAIRTAMCRLLFEPQFAGTLAAEGKRRALACHHPREIALRHLEIYREVLGGAG